MDLPQSSSIPIEPLPNSEGSKHSLLEGYASQNLNSYNREAISELTDEELKEKCEIILTKRVKDGDEQAIFQLGQLHFEWGSFDKALKYFERAPSTDMQSQFQLGVMYFDGLGMDEPDYVKALERMQAVATCTKMSCKHLVHAAEYNIGRAYFQGYGVRTDYEEAEKWWMLASDDGNPSACVRAQSMLAMLYSRKDTADLKKAAFWHSEACGNGNLESQGALGVMYMHGLGVKKNMESAFECLSEASQRGNVYAMGHMVAFYYKRKLYTKCVDMASRVAQLDNLQQVAEETECQENYIRKGVAMACFYYARCLDKQLGIKNSLEMAQHYYSRAYSFDPDVCALLQSIVTHGKM
ncbi:LRP2-binding protein-like isoform X1 [Watersipora subatra]|uniref:LRP2-binding protein-like isoform X1 n=1 Tax=Watersipora subatra TaxID=2589382 RepID=UPI00355C0787